MNSKEIMKRTWLALLAGQASFAALCYLGLIFNITHWFDDGTFGIRLTMSIALFISGCLLFHASQREFI
jgi:hypothetical protein